MDNLKNAKPIEIPEEALRQSLEYEESLQDRFKKFSKRSPFLLAGLTGFVAVCGIGVYKWKSRQIKPSLFLIQLRVAAQSAVIGCLSIGMVYHMYIDYVHKKPKE